MRDLRFPLIVIVFVVVVTVGVGARSLYDEWRVVDPLASIASELDGVRSVEVLPAQGRVRDVVVELDGDVRLEEAYEAIERRASQRLGSSFGRLVLKDRRTPKLTEGFYRIHFALREAIATGRFSEMAEEVEAKLREAGLEEYRIFVGDRHIFVQMYDGSGGYLYEALPRPPEEAGKGGVFPW